MHVFFAFAVFVVLLRARVSVLFGLGLVKQFMSREVKLRAKLVKFKVWEGRVDPYREFFFR